jgi:hypothetical protein
MKRKRQTRLPKTFAAATLAANTLDADARTVDAVVYSGARIPRFSWGEGEYWLSLDVSPKAVDLSRINSGIAPLLDSHERHAGVASVLGRVENARVAGGEVRARLRFSRRPEAQAVLDDVRDGILGAVSVGVVLTEVEEVPRKKGAKGPDADMREFVARAWEIHEVSVVPVGADPGATIQASDSERHPCRIRLMGETSMRKRKKCLSCGERFPADFDGEECPAEGCGVNLEEAEQQRDELARAGRIHQMAAYFELGDTWAQRHIRDGSTPKDAEDDARRIIAAAQPPIDGRLTCGMDWDSSVQRFEGMAVSFAARSRREEPTGPGRRFASVSFAECAFEALPRHQRGILNPRQHGRRVVELAMTNSDFPEILANALNKNLLADYMSATPAHRRIAARRNFMDYRAHRFIRRGDFPQPLQVGEGGEITEGSMGEGRESVTCLKYGRILNLVWEVLVNDDLDAFRDFGNMVARRIVDHEAALFTATCLAAGSGLGPTMSDGVVLHNGTHANVLSAGALSNDRLNEAFGLLAAQTSIDGLKIGNPPRFVVTAASSHILARTLLANIYPTQATEVNAFSGMMEAVYDPNLSGTRYYVVVDPALMTSYIYGSVDGLGPRFEVRRGWEIEGVQVKAVHDFGCGAIDWRGTTTGAGS